jgi:hypothetical protein
MHGGTIGCESVYGTGTSFWFLLPVEGPFRCTVEPAPVSRPQGP